MYYKFTECDCGLKVIGFRISGNVRNDILNIDSEIRNLLINKTLNNVILKQEFCVKKKKIPWL